MSTTVKIIGRSTPALKQFTLDVTGEDLRRAVGRSVVSLLRGHFQQLPPNEAGFPTTRFWLRAADAAKSEITSDGVSITVNQIGVRQRFLGGPINPVRGKFLTIPAIAGTYGHSALEFSNLKIAAAPSPWAGGASALCLAPANAPRAEHGGVDSSSVFFWLVRHVSQKADPSVLPADAELAAAAVAAIRNYLTRPRANGGNR
jgi:hypothetical protein